MLHLPEAVVYQTAQHPLTGVLFPTDIGYFEKAAGHYRRREAGCEQLILICCTDGNGCLELNGLHFSLCAGQACLIPAQQPHSYWADNANPWSIWWVHLSGREITTLAQHCIDTPVFTLTRAEQTIRAFSRLFTLLQHGYGDSVLKRAMFRCWQIVGLLTDTADTHHEPPDGITDTRITRVIHHMHQHLHAHVSLEGLAHIAGCSISTLAEHFKNVTNYAVLDYFIRLKMQTACSLLDADNSSIQDIAATLGYDDPFYFSRRFKRIYGYSPKQYRLLEKG